MRRVLPLVVAALISCTNKPAEGTLKVVVDVSDAALTSRCTKLFARGSTELITEPLDISGKDRVVIAVYQGMQMGEIELEAIGYSDADCLNETVPAERTDKTRHGFGMPAELTLIMKRITTSNDGGIDADGDGFTPPADCNDNDPSIKPGATELCGDHLDNDCNERTDCADVTVCDNQQCGTGALCAGGRCTETQCNDGIDNNGIGGMDCFDADCDGRTCMNAGICEFGGCRATSEVGLCGDGIDNDGDDAGDCADLMDCPAGATCDDQNGCTTTGTCDGVGSCVTQPISCDVVPQCFSGGGVCDVDAGRCPFTLNAGNPCDDGLLCTTADFCMADGGCGGNLTMCNTPPNTACFASVGMCNEKLDGGCRYFPLPANVTGCDDGNACTGNDSCDGDGGCIGMPAMASDCPARECFTRDAGACQPDDLCGYVQLPNNTACSTGVCSGGQCVTAAVFNFPTSNFVEADLPASLGAVDISCGTATINTALADGGANFVNCDGGVRLAPWTTVTNGGNEALLLYMDSLSVAMGSRLRARGARPVILAVKGNVTITGALEVNGFEGAAATRGAGSNTNCGLGTGRPGGIGGTPITAGGGGGGGFGTLGGRGHFGEGGGNSLGGDGGAIIGNSQLIPLVGGCSGGTGGSGSDTNFGRGGRGGGALQVTAGGIIHVVGNVTANGGGGEGGASAARTGGGGGGSGGAILLEANRLTSAISGNVTANGGGAGEGSGVSGDGDNGDNGMPNLLVAQGGVSAACGGSGGNGAASSTMAANGSAPHCNTNMPGGGGGGGIGRIRTNGHDGGCAFNANTWFSPSRSGVGTGCQ